MFLPFECLPISGLPISTLSPNIFYLNGMGPKCPKLESSIWLIRLISSIFVSQNIIVLANFGPFRFMGYKTPLGQQAFWTCLFYVAAWFLFAPFMFGDKSESAPWKGLAFMKLRMWNQFWSSVVLSLRSLQRLNRHSLLEQLLRIETMPTAGAQVPLRSFSS